jgi:hypothetical protein
VHHIHTKEEEEFFFFYSPDMWTLDVIGMIGNLELYQILYWISDPRWSCSMAKLRGSAALELFFQSRSSAKHALILEFSDAMR